MTVRHKTDRTGLSGKTLDASFRFLSLFLIVAAIVFWSCPAQAVDLKMVNADSPKTLAAGTYTYGSVWLGNDGGATGPLTLNIQDGVTISCGEFINAYGCLGTVNQSGGSVTVTGTATDNNAGGATGNRLSLGCYGSIPSGNYNLSGGTLTATNGLTVFGADGYGIFTISSGTATLLGLMGDWNNNGRLVLTSGTLSLGAQGFTMNPGAYAGKRGTWYGTISLGGGTVKASATWSSSLPMALTGTGGNVTFDPNGFDITLSGNLSSTGGLTVAATGGTGSVILSGTNTYTGITTISSGTLKLDTLGSIACTNITMAAGGVFDVTAKTTYTLDGLKAYTFGIDPAGAGLAGRIKSAGLDISNARVAFTTAGLLDDSTYILADYTTLTGTNFAVMSGFPSGYSLDYNYQGQNQIVFARIPSGTLIVIR